jgi:REP element-mobilizing transposase RayT
MGHLSGIIKPNSLRLKGYDYSKAGFYFVTICTQGGQHIFGQIKKGKMVLNEYGKTAEMCLNELSSHYSNMKLDTYTIMPNHIHVILVLHEAHEDDNVGATTPTVTSTLSLVMDSMKNSLSEIIRGFKTFSSRRINEIRNTPGMSVWQRSFYDRIIRDEKELNGIRAYVRINPAKLGKT